LESWQVLIDTSAIDLASYRRAVMPLARMVDEEEGLPRLPTEVR
jgi:hypothetical protein